MDYRPDWALIHPDLTNIICLWTFYSDLSLWALPPGERYLFCCIGVLASSVRAEKGFICIQRPSQLLLCSTPMPSLSPAPFRRSHHTCCKIPLPEPDAALCAALHSLSKSINRPSCWVQMLLEIHCCVPILTRPPPIFFSLPTFGNVWWCHCVM